VSQRISRDMPHPRRQNTPRLKTRSRRHPSHTQNPAKPRVTNPKPHQIHPCQPPCTTNLPASHTQVQGAAHVSLPIPDTNVNEHRPPHDCGTVSAQLARSTEGQVSYPNSTTASIPVPQRRGGR
jgi:hypothetical protein